MVSLVCQRNITFKGIRKKGRGPNAASFLSISGNVDLCSRSLLSLYRKTHVWNPKNARMICIHRIFSWKSIRKKSEVQSVIVFVELNWSLQTPSTLNLYIGYTLLKSWHLNPKIEMMPLVLPPESYMKGYTKEGPRSKLDSFFFYSRQIGSVQSVITYVFI